MSDANGEFVKIYLYLLRLMNMPDASFSISSIADKFDHTEKDIKRALCYWERMQLLRLDYDANQDLTGVHLLDSPYRSESCGYRGCGFHREYPRDRRGRHPRNHR